ncbi:COMM domain-containing protein 8-like [Orussus abietinus]|uniref:COMM domain-containing protein 8-like n=1 Tax=Orussus abietinus TaxID=222816 RepID=UPI0006256F65|nr:COMM domain-containing protein 8-like [Orussus abietinus]
MENDRNCYVKLFSTITSSALNQFLHACIDEICDYSRVAYEDFSTTINWSREEYDTAYALISTLLQNPVLLYLSEEKASLEYLELPEEVRSCVVNCLKLRQEQLTNVLIRKASKKILPTLTDFDWRLRLLMGSSKLATLREPVLQLDLIVEDRKERNIVGMELNKEELETVINALESIKP